MVTDEIMYDQFSPDEKQFLERMFADHLGLSERFEIYLSLPASKRYAKAMEDLDKTPRTGWVKRQIKNPESVMDHIDELTAMAQEFALPKDVSPLTKGEARRRFITMALLHDIPEAIVTDFTPTCPISVPDKDRLEILAARVILESYPKGEALIREYVEQQTSLSQTLHDLDKLAPVFKALEYEGMYPEKRGKLYDDFLTYAKPRLKTDEGRKFAEDIERDAETIRQAARQRFLEEKFAGREV